MTKQQIVDLMTEYLSNGGFFNPEMMDHQAVRDLILVTRSMLIDEIK